MVLQPRRHRLAIAALLLLLTGCSEGRRYSLTGQVLRVDGPKRELTVKHGDIKGFMPAMTMTFKVRGNDADQRHPGDVISATLVVEDTAGYLENIVKTGEAPVPAEAASDAAVRMIQPGAVVPDAELTDQSGQRRRLSDWRGRTVAVTFVYTRCPLPDFCPVMDRRYAAVQRSLAGDAALAERVHLLSVSFDPAYDTPEVLRAHAGRAGADPRRWTYLTGTREAIDPFAGAFGVSIIRDDNPAQEIMHNLRTAVIDRQGRLATVLNGTEWTPDQLLDALRKADGQQ